VTVRRDEALITSTCSHAADASFTVGGSGANIAAL
jgi:hypothetical protein